MKPKVVNKEIPNQIDLFVDYVTNSEHVWDPEKYVMSRNVLGKSTEGIELQFKYSYVFGGGHMTGLFGKDSDRVEAFYREGYGFKIEFLTAKGSKTQSHFQLHERDIVKELLNHLSNN